MSLQYTAPIDDLKFVIQDVLKLSEHQVLFGDLESSDELVDAVLKEMGKFTERVIQPLSALGDREGCKLSDGNVTTPNGFSEAYGEFVAGGWPGMTYSAEMGGLGLPHTVHTAIGEMITAANPGFGMYTGMNKGAISALTIAGSEELKKTYLRPLISGEWAATMNLTEPQAGTDLGLLRTRALRQADGSYRIKGEKIFISGGDHNLTDNIVHLVLARTPDAPAGTRGISLFVVPKYLPDAEGGLGERNPVFCTALEKKLGLKGSATCAMSFEDAKGHIVGEECAGLRAMFAMMNTMRITVGGQAVGMSDIACQNAGQYVRDRMQGRAPGSTSPADQPDPLLALPDIRRMLMMSRAFVEGGRAFILWMGLQLDISEKSSKQKDRQDAENRLSLLTPVVKGYLTEVAEDVISMALQCYGGHGYIAETGIEQVYRDARVSKIYEGATGVQAIDLLGRKVLMNGGSNLEAFIAEIRDTLVDCRRVEELVSYSDGMELTLQTLERSVAWLLENAAEDVALPGSASHHFLMLMGLVCLGYMWCLMGLEASRQKKSGIGSPEFMDKKILTGTFFMKMYLPEAQTLLARIQSGSELVMTLDEASF